MRHRTEPFYKRLFKSRIIIIFEIIVLVFFSSALAREVIRKHQVESEIKKLQAQLESLQDRNIELDKLISYLNSDDYKEEQARLQLGLKKPGEKVVTVLGDSTEENSSDQERIEMNKGKISPHTSNPKKWWNYFFDHNNS